MFIKNLIFSTHAKVRLVKRFGLYIKDIEELPYEEVGQLRSNYMIYKTTLNKKEIYLLTSTDGEVVITVFTKKQFNKRMKRKIRQCSNNSRNSSIKNLSVSWM